MKAVYFNNLDKLFGNDEPYAVASALQGETFRELEQRRTLRFSYQGQTYFIKQHAGSTLKEILKNYAQLKKPVSGAANEWFALLHLASNGIHCARALAFFDDEKPLLRRRSFIVMSDLDTHIDLETFTLSNAWPRLGKAQRRALIKAVAKTARKMHDAGIAHRDFYLCHLLVPQQQLDALEDAGQPGAASLDVYLIDLHRATYRQTIATRSIEKDLGGLFYSVLDIDISWPELVYFIRQYSGGSAKQAFAKNRRLWHNAWRRGVAIYRRYHKRDPADRWLKPLAF